MGMSIDIAIQSTTVSMVSKGASSAEDLVRQQIELYHSPEFPQKPIMF